MSSGQLASTRNALVLLSFLASVSIALLTDVFALCACSCVCADGECEPENEIVFCDRCDIAVHCDCYGVSGVPAGEWYCAPCSLLISQGHFKVTPMSPQFSCAVCWQKGGAMHRLLIEKKNYAKTLAVLNCTDAKPPAQLTFAHVSCAVFINEMFLVDPDRMTPVSGLHNVSPQRFKLKCTICKKLGGACVQCSEKKCCSAMHMQCALENGNRIEVQTDTNTGGGIYTVYCEKHAPLRSTVLKAVDGQVSGGGSGAAHCQVCCYGVTPVPIEGVPNDMLACTHCDLQVHRWCFGEEAAGQTTLALPAASAASSAAVGSTVPFLCRVCERKASNSSLPSPSCALCLTTQGALKPTVEGRWCCLPCTYFTPELFFKDTRALEPIDGVAAAFKARSKMACSLCDRSEGAPIQCFNIRCPTAYHTSCAYASGFEFAENPKGTTGNCPFITHCGVHSRASGAAANIDIRTNPAYANATFTTFTLPNAEDEYIDLTSADGGGGGAGGSGSKANGRKRGRGSYADSSDNDSDVYEDISRAKAASLASAGGTSRQRESRARAELKMSSSSGNGIGQLVFKKKETGRARASGSATPAAAAGVPRRRYVKITFVLDHVPTHIRVMPVDSSEVFINTEADAAMMAAAAAAPTNTKQQQQKRGRFQQQSKGAAANLKTDDEIVAQSESAAAETASSSSAAAGAPAAAAASSRHRAKRRRGAAESQSSQVAAAASSAPQRIPSTPQQTSRMPRAQQNDAAAGTDTDSNDDDLVSRRRSAAEDEPLYCICRRPHHSTDSTMIGCDECNDWFHIVCVGVDQADVEALADSRWECPPCAEKLKHKQ